RQTSPIAGGRSALAEAAEAPAQPRAVGDTVPPSRAPAGREGQVRTEISRRASALPPIAISSAPPPPSSGEQVPSPPPPRSPRPAAPQRLRAAQRAAIDAHPHPRPRRRAAQARPLRADRRARLRGDGHRLPRPAGGGGRLLPLRGHQAAPPPPGPRGA